MLIQQVPVPPVPPTPPMPPAPPSLPDFPPPWVTMSTPALVFSVCIIAIAATVVLWPLVRAIARRIEGKTREDPGLKEEIEDLRHRVHDLDAMQMRLAELEERLDFAERLLTQRREPAALPPEGQR